MKPLIWREPSQSQGLWVPALKAVLFCSLQMALFPSQPHITWKSPLAQCVCAVPLSWEVFCLLKTHSLWATKPSKILYLTALCTLGPKQGLLHSCIQAFYCKQQKISSCQALSYHIKPSYPIPSRPSSPRLLKISLNMKKDIKLFTSTKSALHRLNHKCIQPSQPQKLFI